MWCRRGALSLPATTTVLLAALSLLLAAPPSSGAAMRDARSLSSGTLVLKGGYADQPYCVTLSELEWLCVITFGQGAEGSSQGEHMVSVRTADGGRTWSAPLRIEPSRLTNAYGLPVLTHFGRVYCVYNMNTRNTTTLPDGAPAKRVDMLGDYVARWTDDGGLSWSTGHINVPVRETALDRLNSWGGKVRIGWSVDQAKHGEGRDNGTVYWAVTKVQTYELAPPEEVWFLRSPNMLSERDATRVTFDTLPDGDVGIVPPGGNPDFIEEGHIVPLEHSAGFYALFRTVQGFLGTTHTAEASARGGWVPSTYAAYLPLAAAGAAAGASPTRPNTGWLKQPRGPITARRMRNGVLLLLWYNNGNRDFTNRNPYWLSAGFEVGGGNVQWTQPEIALFNATESGRETTRVGYPDIFQAPGSSDQVYITETQKDAARLHAVPPRITEALYSQRTVRTVAQRGLALRLGATDAGKSLPLPAHTFPALNGTAGGGSSDEAAGFALGVWVSGHAAATTGQTVLDTRASSAGSGVAVLVGEARGLDVHVIDATGGGASFVYQMDAMCGQALESGDASVPHYFAVSVDGGAKVVSASVDGSLCDGGHLEAQGWHWFSPDVVDVTNNANAIQVSPGYAGKFLAAQIYSRYLLTSEMVGNWRAGPAGH